MSVKIDTAVFDRVAGIINHFSKSVYDVQRHIDAYLDSVKQEFNRQLEIIETLLKKAIINEEKAKEAVVVAEKEWQLAIQSVTLAESNKNVALTAMLEAKSRRDAAKEEKDAAKADKDNAYNEKQIAFQDKQNAFQDMKNHYISYDEFQEYVEDFNEKRDIFFLKKDVFSQKKAEYDSENANYKDKLDILKEKEMVLKIAIKRRDAAKKAYYEAKDRHKKALEEYRLRKSNLKEGKRIHTQFEMYYADYYRKYFPGESMSCDTLLTMLRSSMKREFDENMRKIKNATDEILRCSLKENVSVEALYIQDSPRFQKSKETRNRMKGHFKDTMKELNQEMKRPKDEHPDYIERCSRCHLPMYLCECDPPDNPEKHY